MTRNNALVMPTDVEGEIATLGQDIADIAETILNWEIIGVGPIAAWAALGREDACERGWEQVRALMIQQVMQWRAVQYRLAA